MTLTYLVDTDWVIHWFNRHPGIGQRLEEAKASGLALSVISVAELYEGVYSSADVGRSDEQLREFLRGVTVVGVDVETCQIFGRERGRMRSSGRMIGDFDLMIGATALRHNLTLLSNNRRHFELVAGLRLESV